VPATPAADEGSFAKSVGGSQLSTKRPLEDGGGQQGGEEGGGAEEQEGEEAQGATGVHSGPPCKKAALGALL
jgi:hypothetical protein